MRQELLLVVFSSETEAEAEADNDNVAQEHHRSLTISLSDP